MLAALIALALYSVIMTIVLYVLLYFWDKERDAYRTQHITTLKMEHIHPSERNHHAQEDPHHAR